MGLQNAISLLRVLFSLCSLLLMTVTAQGTGQPTVSLMIVTPEADWKEGGRVEMRCAARNLQGSAYQIEWMTVNPPQFVTLGGFTTRVIGRLEFRRSSATDVNIIEYMTITDLQRANSGQYSCSIRTSTSGQYAATANVDLSVLYFPDEPSPVCSPNGPITVQNGTSLSVQCSSEGGNPAVRMTTSSNPPNNKYTCTWQESRMADTVTRSLTFTVAAKDHDASFVCTISSEAFPEMSRDCRMGQKGVITPPSDSTTMPTTEPAQGTAQTDPLVSPTPSAPSVALIAAGAFAAGVISAVVAFILILICKRRGFLDTCRSPKRQTNGVTATTGAPQADPGIEIQSTDDGVYTEPEAGRSTAAQYTYCQTIAVPKDAPYMELEPTTTENKEYTELQVQGSTPVTAPNTKSQRK